jgi:hypothetical protein
MGKINSVSITYFEIQLMPVASRTKARMVLERSKNGIMGWNPARGMNICRHVLLYCVERHFVKGTAPVLVVLPERRSRYTVSEVHSKSEQTRGLNS